MENLMKNKIGKDIVFYGNWRKQNQGLNGSVYGGGGISPTILARDYKDAKIVLVKNGNHNIRYSVTSKSKKTQS